MIVVNAMKPVSNTAKSHVFVNLPLVGSATKGVIQDEENLTTN